MSVVNTFDPKQLVQLDGKSTKRFLRAANEIERPDYGLSKQEIDSFAPLMRIESSLWRTASEDLGDEDLVSLIRFFTLAENLPGWQAGDRSPVIPLMALLRNRDAVPTDLGSWIRSNTENRFLPWGSLLDRL